MTVAQSDRKQQAAKRALRSGRVTLTEDFIGAVVTRVRSGTAPSTAARALGCNAATFDGWMRKGEEQIGALEAGAPPEEAITDYDPDGMRMLLFEQVAIAEAQFEDTFGREAKQRIDDGKEFRGHLALLGRRFPDRWSERRAEPASAERSFEDDARRFFQNLRENAAKS